MRVDSSLHHVHGLAGVHEHDEPPPNLLISEISTNYNFSNKLDIVQTLLGRESLDLHRQH